MTRSFRKEIKEPDTFHRWGEKAFFWFAKNQKTVFAAIGAVIIIALGVVGYIYWSDHVKKQAALSLASADIATSEAAKEQALRRTMKNYGSTRSGVIARLRLATLLKDAGKETEAEKSYREALESSSLNETDREIAERGLAASLARQGKCNEAIPHWRGILNRGSLLAPEDLYVAIGACYETLGKSAEAVRTYEELIQKYPASPFITPDIQNFVLKQKSGAKDKEASKRPTEGKGTSKEAQK